MATPAQSGGGRSRVDRLVAYLQGSFRGMMSGRGRTTATYLHLLVQRLPRGTKIEVRVERNHHRPHFHVSSKQDCDTSVDILTLEALAGQCERKIWREVSSWAYLNREKLLELWNDLNPQASHTFTLQA